TRRRERRRVSVAAHLCDRAHRRAGLHVARAADALDLPEAARESTRPPAIRGRDPARAYRRFVMGERIFDLDTIQREHAWETYQQLAVEEPERRVSWEELVFSLYRRGLQDGRKHCRAALLTSAAALAIVVGQL